MNKELNSDLTKKLKHYRLSAKEYEMIGELLGRPPEGLEWALFSALWSKHCSYKSSKIHLKKLFNKSPMVLESFGENAGVVDLGEGERIAFKMESHNHPSFIEPYQGAATGVGGILRDIFTMGARPIALADYLCFGEPTAPRMTHLVNGVVRGIGGYGNCVGVPTVTGQTEFHASYNNNILVNAMAVGLFRPGEKIFTSKAHGVGNFVVYVGAKTGRDGVHGASMASESFDEESESKRPTIQIGDPFFEKLLIESCLEVMKQDLVVAIQDMGAAGLTSSSFEMAAKGEVGFNVHLDRVPLRDSTITPEEIMLSESQERMLLICVPEKFAAIQKVFNRWNLDAEVIGEVVKERKVKLYWHNEVICDIDPVMLVESAPQYQRPFDKAALKNSISKEEFQQKFTQLSESNDLQTLPEVLEHVRACSRDWIFEQYDQRVGAATAKDCNSPVAVLKLPDSQRNLGVAVGCRPHLMRYNARWGASDAILYPALQMASMGLEAIAVTDCLNFGNPENTKIMGEFVDSIEGMNEACAKLMTPIISGNVSFYNETQGQNITSTPATGLIGLGGKDIHLPESKFKTAGDCIYLLSNQQVSFSGEWGEAMKEEGFSTGQLDVNQAGDFIAGVRNLVSHFEVRATRVVGRFGLAHALYRMCGENLGCKIKELKDRNWLSENLYEVVFVVSPSQVQSFEENMKRYLAQTENFKFAHIGEVVRDKIVLGDFVDENLSNLHKSYKGGWFGNFKELA